MQFEIRTIRLRVIPILHPCRSRAILLNLDKVDRVAASGGRVFDLSGVGCRKDTGDTLIIQFLTQIDKRDCAELSRGIDDVPSNI